MVLKLTSGAVQKTLPGFRFGLYTFSHLVTGDLKEKAAGLVKQRLSTIFIALGLSPGMTRHINSPQAL